MGYVFSPPTEATVSRITDYFGQPLADAQPTALALAKYFSVGYRGRNVYVMNDGSVTEVQPPNWNGTTSPRAVNADSQLPYASSFTYIGGSMGAGFTNFTNPASSQVRSVYLGGHVDNPVNPADVAALKAAGYTLKPVPPGTALTAWPNLSGAGDSSGSVLHRVDSGPGSLTWVGLSGNGWVELTAAGSGAGNVAPVGSEPSPSGHGWLLNDTTLEGVTFLPGQWVPNWGFSILGGGTVVGDFHLRVFRYNGSTYTLIIETAAVGVTLSAAAIPTFGGTTTTATPSFGVGDKLYIDLLVKTTNDGGGNIIIYDSNDVGLADPSLSTPGYG